MAIIAQRNNVVIRHYLTEDPQRIAEIANDPEIAKNMLDSFPSPYTYEAAQEWVKLNMHQDAKDFALEYDGELIGAMGYTLATDSRSHVANFGYWLGVKYRGQGIMTQAVGIFADWVFDMHSQVTRLEARIYHWNTGSMRVLEKNEFEFEGVIKQDVQKDNKIIDTHMYARLR